MSVKEDFEKEFYEEENITFCFGRTKGVLS